jgi:hypothetical protein
MWGHTPTRVPDTHTADKVFVQEGVNMQSDTDTPTDNVRPFPGATPEPQQRPKADPTSALRSKRYRRARKHGAMRDGRASNRDGKPAAGGQAPQGENQNEIKPSVTVHVAPPLTADPDVRASVQRHGRGIRFAALVAALEPVGREDCIGRAVPSGVGQ